ncbi:MAG: dephospho-CoA kinase [Thermodesulfovibrionales bacterium]
MIAALTGNYGMGKSTVLACFNALGAITIDSDRIVAELLVKKPVVAKISRVLGPGVLAQDGRLDKKRTAALVFTDKRKRRKLENLLHPLVFREVEKRIRKIRAGKAVVIVEVPLLFEGRYQSRFARTITVHTTRKTALARLAGSGISGREALRRLRAQLPISVKKKRADFTVDNNGSRASTRAQVGRIYRVLLSESA